MFTVFFPIYCHKRDTEQRLKVSQNLFPYMASWSAQEWLYLSLTLRLSFWWNAHNTNPSHLHVANCPRIMALHSASRWGSQSTGRGGGSSSRALSLLYIHLLQKFKTAWSYTSTTPYFMLLYLINPRDNFTFILYLMYKFIICPVNILSVSTFSAHYMILRYLNITNPTVYKRLCTVSLICTKEGDMYTHRNTHCQQATFACTQ